MSTNEITILKEIEEAVQISEIARKYYWLSLVLVEFQVLSLQPYQAMLLLGCFADFQKILYLQCYSQIRVNK